MILDPSAMYSKFGIVSTPVVCNAAKGCFNFFVQTGLLVGTDVCAGQKKISGHLKQQRARFGKFSIAFQVVGQVSAVSTYALLAEATQCWKGLEEWQTFCFLTSQHSASTTVLVGIANNAVIRFFVDENDRFARMAANVLFYTGVVAATPIYASIVTACCSVQFIFIAFASAGGVYFMSKIRNKDEPEVYELLMGMGPVNLLGITTIAWVVFWFFAALLLNVCWFLAGVWAHPFYSFMLLGAFVLELIAPILLICYFMKEYLGLDFDLTQKKQDLGLLTFMTFTSAMLVSYINSMLVPAGILSQHGYLASAAPLAFWGKKIKSYFKYTFILPIHKDIAIGASAIVVAHVWLSEFIALWT